MAVLTWINLTGIRRAAGAASWFAVLKIAPLLVFAAVGVFFVDPSAFAEAPIPEPSQFSHAVLVLIFAFVGFETTTIAAGEARAPTRDIPWALLMAIGISTGLYILIQSVCIGVLPELADSPRPLADVAERIAGAPGGAFISLGALISTTGVLLAALITGPRVLYAMSVQDRLPGILSRTHARWKTPVVSILVTTIASLALALSGTFVYLATLSVIARLSAYVATAVAVPVFRRRVMAPAGFRLRAAGVIVAFTCLSCIWLLTTSALNEVRDVAIAAAAGFVFYGMHAAMRRARESRRPPAS
jgi:amino acid transporter